MLFATGRSGTIGRHLEDGVNSLSVNLAEPLEDVNLLKFESSDNLLHLAAVVGTTKVMEDKKHSREVNVNGTVRLAEAFKKKSTGKFVFISTSHVYKPSIFRLTEFSELNPPTLYAEQKLEAEFLLTKIFESEPTRLCIVRVFSVLDWEVGPLTLGAGIQKLTDRNSDYLLQNADDVRDFLTPRKIASTLTRISSHPEIFGILNLCSGTGLSLEYAARFMLQSSGFEVPNERIISGNSEHPVIVGDNRRLLSFFPDLQLSWKPSSLS